MTLTRSLIFLSALITLSTASETDEWEFALGGGFIGGPSYLGDDDYQLSAVPYLRVAYGERFFASQPEGAGYKLVDTDSWEIGPLLKYRFSRDEDGDRAFRIAGSESDDLRGLDDVDGTLELGFFASYTSGKFETRLELRQGINGHEGFVGEAEFNYKGQATIGKYRGFFSIGPRVRFGDSTFTSAYFDVNAAQSLASGLSQYDADGGITSYGLQSSILVPLSQQTSLIGYLRYDRLTGDVADSSLVQERGSENQFTAGVFLGYKF